MSNEAQAQTEEENPVDKAMREAEAQAAQADEQTAQPGTEIQAVQTGQHGQVQTYAPAAPPSLDSLSQGSMNVDSWLKVNEFGLTVDNKDDLIDSVKVVIDFAEVSPFEGVRFGNPPTYLKTYDGQTCSTGGTWTEALQKAQSMDSKCRPYKGADVPMTLLEDAKEAKEGKVIAEAGVRLGHSTSITNRAAFSDFYEEAKKQGLENGAVEVEITQKKMTNSNGQKWGILIFKLLGAYGG